MKEKSGVLLGWGGLCCQLGWFFPRKWTEIQRMRGLSQVSSAMKSISGGNTWCRSCEVRSSWMCSRNWKKMRLEQRERGGNVAAALTTEEIGTKWPQRPWKWLWIVYLQSMGSHYRGLKQEHGFSDLWFVFLKGHFCGRETSQLVTGVETGWLLEDDGNHLDKRRQHLRLGWWLWSWREGDKLEREVR